MRRFPTIAVFTSISKGTPLETVRQLPENWAIRDVMLRLWDILRHIETFYINSFSFHQKRKLLGTSGYVWCMTCIGSMMLTWHDIHGLFPMSHHIVATIFLNRSSVWPKWCLCQMSRNKVLCSKQFFHLLFLRNLVLMNSSLLLHLIFLKLKKKS